MRKTTDIKTIVKRLYESQKNSMHCTEIEAMQNSLAAAKMTLIIPPFSAIEGQLHVELIKYKADELICLKAWALMADLRSQET